MLSIFTIPALAAESASEPWKIGKVEAAVVSYPEQNADAETLFAVVSQTIAAHQDRPAIHQIIFHYTRDYTSFSSLVNWVLIELDDTLCGIWPTGDTYAFVRASTEKAAHNDYRLVVQIETAGCYDPSGKTEELHSIALSLAQEAVSHSDTDKDRLAYVNRHLSQVASYDAAAEPFSAYAALVDGRAACSGYTAAVSLLCRYLQIPCCAIQNSTHIWNSVFVDGEWLMWDATWSDTTERSDDYFLVKSIEDDTNAHVYDSDVLTSARSAARRNSKYYKIPLLLQDKCDYFERAGIDASKFAGGVTRGELTTIIAQLRGAALDPKYAAYCNMTDVADDISPYVGYCIAEGLMFGYGERRFGPEDPVTLNAACTVALRLIQHPETEWEYQNAATMAVSLNLLPPGIGGNEPISVHTLELLLDNVAKTGA